MASIIQTINNFFQGNSRTVAVKKNIVASLFIRAISIGTSLLLIPATIDYVSSELYGVWLTLSTIVQWLSFFDIGFGNGLRNKLAESIAKGKYKLGKIFVSTTYFILSIIFLLVGIIAYFITPYISWHTILNVSIDLEPTIINVVHIVLIAFVFQIVLKLIQNVTQAFQLQSLASAIDTLGNVFALIFIIVLTKVSFPSLENIALVFTSSPILVLLIFSIVLYFTRFKSVAPSISSIRLRFAKELFSLGSKFFIIQIVSILLYQTTNFIISYCCGPESVTVYNIVYKYLSVALMLFNIVMAPIWSAFTDAYTKGDYDWMKNQFNQLTKICVGCSFLLCLMVVISPWVYDVWIGDKVTISLSTTICLAFYIGITSYGTLTTMVLNGIGKIKLQLLLSVFSPFIYLPLAYFLGKNCGLNGVAISLIVIVIPPVIVQFIQVRKIINNKALGIWAR